jgi:lipoprotein-releasing system permease protein
LSGVPLGVGTLVALIAQGVTLPREFYITELPVKLDPVEIAIFGASAFAMCLLATLYPSKKASQLKPADGLRHG